MKSCIIKNQFLLISVTAALGLMLAGRVTAQTLTVLHNFCGTNDYSGPFGPLFLFPDTLYWQDIGGHGVFAVNTDRPGPRSALSPTSGEQDHKQNKRKDKA